MKMERWRISSYSKIQVVVAGGLLLLLPLLAMMQYRLLGKVSEAERERMRASLQVSADRFSIDFDQELIRVYSAFLTVQAQTIRGNGLKSPLSNGSSLATDSRQEGRPDNDAVTERSIALLNNAFNRWHETTAYPRLIESIYLVRTPSEAEAAGPAGLLKLEVEPGRPQPVVGQVEWPAGLTGVQRQLTAKREVNVNELLPVATTSDGHPYLLFQLVDFRSGLPGTAGSPGPRGERERGGADPLGFGIVTINLNYLREEMLPALARHHFVDGDRKLFDMAISPRVDADRPESSPAIWRSDADRPTISSTPWDFRASDLSVRIFNLRADLLRQQLRRWRPAPDGSATPNGTLRLALINGRLIFSEELKPLWDLHLRHYTGSLDVAVANARRTNLMISLAILSLLTASFLLMLVSSGRARRLAQEQMNFVAGVSHELRTPLAVIDSAGYNLSRGFVKRPEATREYGEMIRAECRRLAEMVEQVLDFATFRSGRQVFDYQPIPLSGIVEEAVRASQPLLDEGGFTIEQQMFEASPGEPDSILVLADRQAMVRALRNLLSNAMKYGGDDRWIGLRVFAVRRGRHQMACLTISDHGRGISREDLSHIFEPFYRSSDVRLAQIQGNGLGLSLVRNIVESHQGTINVESTPGQGTSFTIILPTASLPVAEEVLETSPLLTETRLPTR